MFSNLKPVFFVFGQSTLCVCVQRNINDRTRNKGKLARVLFFCREAGVCVCVLFLKGAGPGPSCCNDHPTISLLSLGFPFIVHLSDPSVCVRLVCSLAYVHTHAHVCVYVWSLIHTFTSACVCVVNITCTHFYL